MKIEIDKGARKRLAGLSANNGESKVEIDDCKNSFRLEWDGHTDFSADLIIPIRFGSVRKKTVTQIDLEAEQDYRIIIAGYPTEMKVEKLQ